MPYSGGWYPGGAQSLNPYIPAERYTQGKYQPRQQQNQPLASYQNMVNQVSGRTPPPSTRTSGTSAPVSNASVNKVRTNAAPSTGQMQGQAPQPSWMSGGEPAWTSGSWGDYPISSPSGGGGGGGGSSPSVTSGIPQTYSGVQLNAEGHGDYGEGYDSLGNPAIGSIGTGVPKRVLKQQFEMMQMTGQTNWSGSFENWLKNGMPLAGRYTPEQMAAIVSGVKKPSDFNYGQPTTPTVPGGPTQGIFPGETATPNPDPTPGNPGGTPAYNYQYSIPSWVMTNDPAWWQNANNQNAAAGWVGANIPLYQLMQNDAANQNNYNLGLFDRGWGVESDLYNMAMQQALAQLEYNNSLNNLDYNYYATQLGSQDNALNSLANLYGQMGYNNSMLYGNMYGADQGLLGNALGTAGGMYGSNMGLLGDAMATGANVYGTNINALNDWYNQQARNQVDLQLAAISAFGRDQLPNTRFLANWG